MSSLAITLMLLPLAASLPAFDKAKTNTSTGVVVYSKGEGGYYCIKIPSLLRTASGTLLAFAEARMHSCSDFAWTDIVVKSSRDHGSTWSSLRVVRSESGEGLPSTVVGNAAPVQLRGSGRILLPHTRNNTDVWSMYSDDDGQTWSRPRLIDNVTLDSWRWVGTGPPSSIQLASGRVIVPSYHGKIRGDFINNIVHGHLMLSDDEGDTWRLGAVSSRWNDLMINENSAVQLTNGSVLVNARSLANPFINQVRIQAISNDQGQSFESMGFVRELPQPVNGCQGSTVRSEVTGHLFFSGPDSKLFRTKLSIWMSKDEGGSWQKRVLVDMGASGYSSMQVQGSDIVSILYEQSDKVRFVMEPDRFIFKTLPPLA